MKPLKLFFLTILLVLGCSDDSPGPAVNAGAFDSGVDSETGVSEATVEDAVSVDATMEDTDASDVNDSSAECFSQVACSTFVDGLALDGTTLLVPRSTDGAEVDEVTIRGLATESNAPTVMVRATAVFDSGEFVRVSLDEYSSADLIELTSANVTDSCGEVTEFRFRVAFSPGADDLSGPCF